MESWQSALAIAVAVGCACLVGWRVLRPFLPRRPRSEQTELMQIEPATAGPDGMDDGNAVEKSNSC